MVVSSKVIVLLATIIGICYTADVFMQRKHEILQLLAPEELKVTCALVNSVHA